MSSKFKVGDRVVFARTNKPSQERYVGKVLIIEELKGQIATFKDEYVSFLSYKLEHEEVYNSPLYQALK